MHDERKMKKDIAATEKGWAKHLAKRNREITDEKEHYELKNDLVEHAFNMQGIL